MSLRMAVGWWLRLRIEAGGVFVLLREGQPTEAIFVLFAAGDLDQTGREPGPTFAQIRPQGDVLALNLGNTHTAFVEISMDADAAEVSVQPIGDPLQTGQWIAMGQWSPDGHHYGVADTAWGPDPLDAVFNGPDQIVSVQFDPEGDHRIASVAEVSLSPESLAIDPQGEWVVAVNMERTYLPEGWPYRLFGRRHR